MRVRVWTLVGVLAGCGFHALGSGAFDGGAPGVDAHDLGGDLDGGGDDGGDFGGGGGGDGGGAPWTPPSFSESDLPTATRLYAVWGDAPDDVYVAGDNGFIAHSTGDGTWSQSQTEMFTSAVQGLTGAPGRIAAVADDGAILTSAGDGNWDWTVPTTTPLFGVWQGGDELVAVGGAGTTVDVIGGGMPTVAAWPGMSGAFRAVWGVGGTVYVVGDGGQILRRDGAGPWRATPLGAPVAIAAVWAAAADDVYLVGDGGAIYHSTGNDDWTRQANADSRPLHGVYGSGPHDLWAVGEANAVLHSTGDGTWTPVAVPDVVRIDYYAVWASGDDVYLVGQIGTILHGHR